MHHILNLKGQTNQTAAKQKKMTSHVFNLCVLESLQYEKSQSTEQLKRISLGLAQQTFL